MPQPRPDGIDVDAGAEQMDRRGVSQGILILLMICPQQGFVITVIPSME